MKKIYTILIMCVFFSLLSTEVKAQVVMGETFLGLNFSQIDGDKAYGYKRIGLQGGLGVIVPIYKKDNFSLDASMEVAFNQKGAHQGPIYNDVINGDTITGQYDVYLNYLEVPLILYFTDKRTTSFGIGASYGRLMRQREYEHGKEAEYKEFNRDDICILADLKFTIHERLKLGFRYQYSLAAIRTRDFNLINGEPDLEWQNVTQYNNVLTARLIYVFNEDKSQYVYDEYHFTGDNPKIHQKMIDKELKKLRKQQEKKDKKAGK